MLTNLHNPTSNLAGELVLRQVSEIAGRAGAHVLVDEVYLDAALPAQRSAAHLGERFVVTSSLTKCYGLSGLRCGWIIAAPELTERIWRLNELFGVAQAHSTERLSLLALARLDEIAAVSHAHLAHNRALANAFFAARDELDCAPMAGGITAFPKLVRGNVDALNRLLLEHYDTSIVPGRFFGLAEHFRIGVGQPTGIVEAGLERLGAALDALR
jgi:aspartate/methionine/tyrosine aminotransferase